MDTLTPAKRSLVMSKIHAQNTSPEMKVRKIVYRNGYRYRLYRKDLPGKPDLAFIAQKKAIFVNGCFWHGHFCKKNSIPKTNQQYWIDKIQKNKLRDRKQKAQLTRMGWKYLVVWECELKNEKKVETKIVDFLSTS